MRYLPVAVRRLSGKGFFQQLLGIPKEGLSPKIFRRQNTSKSFNGSWKEKRIFFTFSRNYFGIYYQLHIFLPVLSTTELKPGQTDGATHKKPDLPGHF